MPDQVALLRRTVADFFEVDEAAVGPAFSLVGPRGVTSIARASLDAAIRRRLGHRSQAVYTASTFADLAAEVDPSAILPTSTPIVTTSAPALSLSANAARCGIDMESVDSLPAAPDAWADPFYRATFAPAEIAYCLAQAAPALHFCARWCAKEALRKCDPAYLAVDLHRIEVAHEPSGAPFFLQHDGDPPRRLPHALSLSHHASAAVAVVVLVEPTPTPTPATPIAPTPTPPPSPSQRRGGFLPTLIALGALALSALALYRTYR